MYLNDCMVIQLELVDILDFDFIFVVNKWMVNIFSIVVKYLFVMLYYV